MKNKTYLFNSLYIPLKAFTVFRNAGTEKDMYVEAYDYEKGGFINAHPLSELEADKLAEALYRSSESSRNYLQPAGLMPENILHTDNRTGTLIWYTSPFCQILQFAQGSGLCTGTYPIPMLIWKADKVSLSLFAIKGKDKPELKTSLHHAPFLNTYGTGKICMGNVSIEPDICGSMEQFIEFWQNAFFNSLFSHVIGSHRICRSEVTSLMNKLLEKKTFPAEELIRTGKNLADILKINN